MGVNKVVYNGNTLVDMTGVTVTPETLAAGETALNAAGDVIVGTLTGGITVQRKTGNFRTNSSGKATIDCGFKPDAIFFHASRSNDTSSIYYAGVAFIEYDKTSMETYLCGTSNSYPYTKITVEQDDSGFSVTLIKYSTSYSSSSDTYRTLEYVAIKYTE